MSVSYSNMSLILVLILSIAESPRANVVDEQATCTAAHSDHVETLFNRRKASNKALREAERALALLLQSCPTIPRRDKLQTQLKLVQEESAQFHLQMAQFYLSGRVDGRGLMQGALFRLKRIYDEYPNFSRRDEALYMLADVSAQVGNEEEATRYFRSVITEFPESKYAKLARQRLE